MSYNTVVLVNLIVHAKVVRRWWRVVGVHARTDVIGDRTVVVEWSDVSHHYWAGEDEWTAVMGQVIESRCRYKGLKQNMSRHDRETTMRVIITA